MNVYAVRRKDPDRDVPAETRAVRVSPGVLSEIAAWCGGITETTEDVARPGRRVTSLLVRTPDGIRVASIDDWIVREWADLDDEASVSFRVYDPLGFLVEYGPEP